MNKPVVFIDGDCFVCNRLANFILQRSNRLNIHVLQSEIAKSLLIQYPKLFENLNTLVLLENNVIYLKSNAILRIFGKMKGLWPLLGLFWLVPAPIRDGIYDVFAKYRHRWFNQGGSCQIKNSLPQM
jgi:predicted DCC family thiol-disulfide oxidoreductase YuxK